MIRLRTKYVAWIIFLLAILGPTGPDLLAENAGNSPPSDAPADYMLIVTGGELLRGTYADGHTLFITRTLGPLGCRCIGSMCVGDEEKDLYDALVYAGRRADLIIVTGGLGPTDDDITRETLSKYTEISLHENPDAVEAMMRRFGVRTRDELRENLRRQTLTPEKGRYFPNPNGTAVGLVFEEKNRVVVALPGPPRELQPMVEDQLVPYLSDRFGIHSIGCSLTMRFVGIGESQIDHTLHKQVVLPEDLIISSLFELGRVDFTLSLPGNSPVDRERLNALKNELFKHIGEYMYSDDGSTLEECVLRMLAERNTSLVTAEVGSGGAIAASLNTTQNAARVYSGGYVAPSDRVLAAILDLSSNPVPDSSGAGESLARSVAQRICEKTNSEWAIVVSEVVEPENKSPFVWIALGARQEGFDVIPVSLRGHGETGQARLVNRCLDLLRRKFEKK